MNGKGDSPRPMSVPRDEYERNWERTFRKEKKEVIIGNEKSDNINDNIWIDNEREN